MIGTPVPAGGDEPSQLDIRVASMWIASSSWSYCALDNACRLLILMQPFLIGRRHLDEQAGDLQQVVEDGP